MGVTAIKRVINESSHPVSIVNRENPEKAGNSGRVGPNEFLDVDIWIPWCCDYDEVRRKSITVTLGGGSAGVYDVYQCAGDDGDFVRVELVTLTNPIGPFDPGPPIGGDSHVNGDRELIVGVDRRLSLRSR